MSNHFKIFLLVILSVFSTLNLSANDTFFSIEKEGINTHSIDSWKVLDNYPNLRTDVSKLSAIDDIVITKNIDHSILKTELDNLASNQADLINSLEVANGSKAYPSISNKGVLQTDGNLVGKLENGQFVPTANAQASGTMDFVVMLNGEIRLGTKHTFLSGGADVLGAGTVKFNNGVLKDISNASGHYLPDVGEGMNFLRLFKSKGVNVDNAFLSIYHESGTLFKQVHPTSNARKLYD